MPTHPNVPENVPAPEGVLASEHDTPPACVIVHDPVSVGAFRGLEAVDDTQLKPRFLFDGRPDSAAFSAAHARFVQAIARFVERVLPLESLVTDQQLRRRLARMPNQVYTRDGALTLPWSPDAFIAGRMRSDIRGDEPEVMRHALGRLGLTELIELPPGVFLEGGDVIPVVLEGRRTLLVGFGPRSSEESLDVLAELIPDHVDELIGLELASGRINLDGVLVPVADDVVVAHPPSVCRAVRITRSGRDRVDVIGMLRDLGTAVVEPTSEESKREASNCLCLGGRRLIAYDLTPRVHAALANLDVDVVTVPGAELIKGTGGPRCMSRPVYRR
jgi:N-dimethylarginine dimethylaminohydrolase